MQNISFVGKYNEQLFKEHEQEQLERGTKEINSWYASGLGTCPTGRYLERMGVPPDEGYNARTLDVFAVGKSEEAFFLEKLQKSEDLKIKEQVRIEDKTLNLSGYADFVASLADGTRLVGEIKSKNSKAFWYMDKKKQGAQIHHQMQLWAYLYCLNIEEGRIIYISKDDRCKLEYTVRLDNPVLQKLVMDELNLLNRAWKAQLPPAVTFDDKDWRAKYCRWHNQCKCQKEYIN